MPESADDSITGLLAQLEQGNQEAEARLVAQVFDELQHLAGNHMRKERANHTLQPTALVNLAYVRLPKQPVHWQNQTRFFAVAWHVRREILVDHARAKHSRKHAGDGHVMHVSSRTVKRWRVRAMSVGIPAQTTRIADAATPRAAEPRKGTVEKRTFYVAMPAGITLHKISRPSARQGRLNKSETWAAHVSQQRVPSQS